jgi:hypothetical protein
VLEYGFYPFKTCIGRCYESDQFCDVTLVVIRSSGVKYSVDIATQIPLVNFFVVVVIKEVALIYFTCPS